MAITHLLLNEQPLLLLPELATQIGLNEAIILQQVHYWLIQNQKTERNFYDGFYWTYNSYRSWQNQFPFWSQKTIQRAISTLHKKGLLIASEHNRMKGDRSKWYRIDYSALMMSRPSGQNDQTHLVKLSRPSGQNDQTNTRDYTRDYLTEIKNTTSIDANTKTLLLKCATLPHWGHGDLQTDCVWLSSLIIKYPRLTVGHIDKCCAFHDGKRVTHRGVWKNRIDNWMKHENNPLVKKTVRQSGLPDEVELEEQERRFKGGSTG